LGIALAITINTTYNSDYVLTWHHYASLAGLLIALLLKIVYNRAGRYATAAILILGTLNIFNFQLIKTTDSFAVGSITLVAFEPYLSVLLIIYYFVNKTAINKVLRGVLRGSEKEQIDDHQKMVDFYLHKFGECTQAEFVQIFKNLNAYPEPAQEALKQLRDKYYIQGTVT